MIDRGEKERLEGTVTGAYKDSKFRVELDNSGHEVMGYLCGKMRRFRIRVLLGDRVTVEVSGYDPDRGRIVYRHR
jgi:translation initiation factor IF-1